MNLISAAEGRTRESRRMGKTRRDEVRQCQFAQTFVDERQSCDRLASRQVHLCQRFILYVSELDDRRADFGREVVERRARRDERSRLVLCSWRGRRGARAAERSSRSIGFVAAVHLLEAKPD